VFNTNSHTKNVLAEGDLQSGATIKDDLMVRTERSHQVRMPQVAHERYAEFDAKRRGAKALVADAEDIKDLEAVEKHGRKGGKHAS